MDAALGAWTKREVVVINALRILAHTQLIDSAFVQRCIAKASAHMHDTPGFGALLEQDMDEFGPMLAHLKGCKSVLEIGSRYGESLKHMAAMIEPRSKVVAVDLPYTGGCGGLPEPEPLLREAIGEIARLGHDAHVFLGNSRDPEIVPKVQALGPYDFLFIDGDHSYEGVKADWENYGPHARIVAFHDIINNTGCYKLWNDIKGKYRHVEYTDSCWLGIGVLFKD